MQEYPGDGQNVGLGFKCPQTFLKVSTVETSSM